MDAYIDIDLFQDSLNYCLYAVSGGVIVGFTLLFMVYAISAAWNCLKSIAGSSK